MLLTCVMAVSAAGCGSGDNEKPRIENEVYSMTKDDTLIGANTGFAFEMFSEMNADKVGENIFMSPLSISQALGMAYNGAAGETKTAMAETLKVDGIDDAAFNNGHKYLMKALNASEGVDVDINNSVWIREEYEVYQEFIDTNIEVFDAYVERLDFSEDSAAETMNKWIEDKTNGLIDHMIDPPIDPLVVMYLINTIYFKGEWKEAFDKEDSRDRQFTGYDGVTDEVPSMFRKGDYRYAKTDDYRIIALPYEEDDVAMYLVLPEGYDDVNQLIGQMTPELWYAMQDGMREIESIPVVLPKFKIEYGIEDLVPALESMGMGIAFDEFDADFSRISETGDRLYISRVLHKAVVEVDEQGTEAAAATVVEMKEESAEIDPAQFIADRPFMFIIADEKDGSILFMGKVDEL